MCRVAAALAEILSDAREELVLRPIDLAKRAKVPHQVVGEVFKALAERGYMECIRTARGLACAVPRGSPLRSAGYEDIYGILEAL